MVDGPHTLIKMQWALEKLSLGGKVTLFQELMASANAEIPHCLSM